MRKYAVLALIVILALMMSGCAPFSPAPPTKAILEGRVVVPQRAVRQVGGQALAGATVRVKDLEGNIVATTTTDANGYYRVEVPAGGPYIIEVVKGSIKVLDVSPQVEVGETYPLGVADATSTAVALVFQAKVEAGEDPAEIDLDELAEDPKIKEELAQAIEEALAAGEDPTTAPEVIHLVQVIVTPPAPAPAPAPAPKPTPKPDTTPPTLKSLTAYLDPSGTRAAKIVDGKWTLEWTVGETVTKIEAIASEPVRLAVPEAQAVVKMSGKGWDPKTDNIVEIDAEYGTIKVDGDEEYGTTLIITPYEGNETAGLEGTFTFTVAAGVVEDLAGNKNDAISVTLVVGAAEGADTSWYSDSETSFTITTAAQLAGLAKLVNDGNDFSGKRITLGASIDLKGLEWTPIGTATRSFRGTFDGNNMVISNLRINQPNEVNIGLFGHVSGSASLLNVKFNNVKINAKEAVGALVGNVRNLAQPITNVHAERVTINSTHWAGGLVGYSYASFTNCSVNDVTVKLVFDTIKDDNGDKAGGLTGYQGEGSFTYEGCETTNVNISGVRDVGGLVGCSNEGVTFNNCHVTNGSVKADNATHEHDSPYAGGVVGRAAGAITLSGCSANVTVSSYKAGFAGELVGGPAGNFTITTNGGG